MNYRDIGVVTMMRYEFPATVDKDGKWSIDAKELKRVCKEMGEFTLIVCDPETAISLGQEKWYKMTVRKLSEHTGESQQTIQERIRAYCGFGLLEGVIADVTTDGNYSTRRKCYKDLSVKDMSILMDNMVSWGLGEDLPVVPPTKQKWSR